MTRDTSGNTRPLGWLRLGVSASCQGSDMLPRPRVEDRPPLFSGEPPATPEGWATPVPHHSGWCMPGDTARGIGRARQEVVCAVGRIALCNGVVATWGFAQDCQWDGRVQRVVKQSLMRGGVIRQDEGLVSRLACRGGGGEGALIIVHTPLKVEVGLHPSQLRVCRLWCVRWSRGGSVCEPTSPQRPWR